MWSMHWEAIQMESKGAAQDSLDDHKAVHEDRKVRGLSGCLVAGENILHNPCIAHWRVPRKYTVNLYLHSHTHSRFRFDSEILDF